MLSSRDYSDAIAAHFTVPAHIEAAARAVRYDLYHGPSWVRVPGGDVTRFTYDDHATFRDDLGPDTKPGDVIAETYLSPVADALRAFIDDLPSELWVDTMSDCVLTSEPEAWEDEESGERVEPEWSDYVHLDGRDIVTALFGGVIGAEFR